MFSYRDMLIPDELGKILSCKLTLSQTFKITFEYYQHISRREYSNTM